MPAIQGLRGTGDWGTDERPKNFREFILWRDPNGDSPLQALMARARSESVDDPEFAWWEEELMPVRLQVTAAVTTTQTTIIIDTGDALDLVAGDVLMVEAENETFATEFVEVASVTNTTTFVVVRARAGTSGATIADDSWLTKIGNVFEEGTTSPQASTRNPLKKLNYCQIFKTAYRITETAKRTRARTGPALQNDKRRKAFDHSVALEYAYMFGKPYEDTTGAKPKRYTGGLLHFLADADANENDADHCVFIWTTTATEDDILNNAYKMWDHRTGGRGGGNERIGLWGNGAINTLNKIIKNSNSTQIRYDGTIKFFGMELTRVTLPQGTFYLRSHPLMNKHGRYTNSGFFINPGTLVDRPLRKTKSMSNIQANDADEEKGQWLTESGLEVQHAKTMAYWGAFNTASAT